MKKLVLILSFLLVTSCGESQISISDDGDVVNDTADEILDDDFVQCDEDEIDQTIEMDSNASPIDEDEDESVLTDEDSEYDSDTSEVDEYMDEDIDEIPEETFTTCGSYKPVQDVGAVTAKELNEISGIIFSRKNKDVIWTHNDSGGNAYIYAFNKAGDLLGKILLQDLTPNDWEDIAIGPCEIGGSEECIFVADTGDNSDAKQEVGLVRFKEPQLDGINTFSDIIITDYDYYRFTYEDRPHDCESFIVHPDGNRYLFSKEREERDTHIYKFPSEKDGDLYIAKKVGTLSLKNGLIANLNLATAADIHPDGSRILIRTYSDIFEFRVNPDNDFITELLASERINLVAGSIISEQQGEAISYNPFTGSIFHIGENPGQITNPPVFELSCN